MGQLILVMMVGVCTSTFSPKVWCFNMSKHWSVGETLWSFGMIAIEGIRN